MERVNRCHAVEDQDSIKVIQLVLDRTGLKPLRPDSGARTLHNDPLGTSDIGGDVWETETPLSGHTTPCVFQHASVDEHDQAPARCGVAMPGDVHHRHPDELSYLRGGEADAGGVSPHRIDEIGRHPLGSKSARLHAGFAEERVRENQHGSDQIPGTLTRLLELGLFD